MERVYDAVVVGSGFGGGIAACRLAEAGKRVCVLERGIGAVHGYTGLHVLDGSIVPTALGVNPSKTIAAMAERGVHAML